MLKGKILNLYGDNIYIINLIIYLMLDKNVYVRDIVEIIGVKTHRGGNKRVKVVT